MDGSPLTDAEYDALCAAAPPSTREWSDACRRIKDARDGAYPADWFERILSQPDKFRFSWRASVPDGSDSSSGAEAGVAEDEADAADRAALRAIPTDELAAALKADLAEQERRRAAAADAKAAWAPDLAVLDEAADRCKRLEAELHDFSPSDLRVLGEARAFHCDHMKAVLPVLADGFASRAAAIRRDLDAGTDVRPPS